MWAVGKMWIRPDQITPSDPIPYLLSFSGFQGLIQFSLIRVLFMPFNMYFYEDVDSVIHLIAGLSLKFQVAM